MNKPGSSATKYVIPAVVLAVIALTIIAVYATSSQDSAPAGQITTTNDTTTDTSANATYRDGQYTADGDYVSPGGPRTIGVTLTLADGVITEAIFEGRATDPNSMRFQGEFRDNFQAMVVGRNLDQVSLTKVAGSSLSPKGFTDALTKIKAQAHS